MRFLKIIQESFKSAFSSAVAYRKVTFPDGADFRPDQPFKGLHIGTAGSVTIVGLDGRAETMVLGTGSWAYGGQAIIASTTTAENIHALY